MRVAASWVTRLVAFMIIALAVALVAVLMVIPRVTGSVPLTVLSGSMTPTVPVGAVILVKQVDTATLTPGDIITFQVAPGVREYITHRIVRLEAGDGTPTFITKGDANNHEDLDPVPAAAVRGEVWFDVPLVGYAADWFHGLRGVALLALLAGVLLLFHIVGEVLRPVTPGRAHRVSMSAS
jgi:signal peptidase I